MLFFRDVVTHLDMLKIIQTLLHTATFKSSIRWCYGISLILLWSIKD